MSFPQLSGHANSIQLTADGTLLIKQTLRLEHEFYTMMEQARAMGALDAPESDNALDQRTLLALKNLNRLSRFVSKFYGVLTESNVGVEALNVSEEAVPITSTGDTNAKQFLVLSNLVDSFKKPNVLDLKLGTVLYDELDQACSEDKKARMIKAARETTIGECGLRLTAFQVSGLYKTLAFGRSSSSIFVHPQPPTTSVAYSDTNSLMPVTTPKIYGKSLKKEQLSEGIRRVFPVLGEPIPILVPGAASPSVGSSSTSGASTPRSDGFSTTSLPPNIPISTFNTADYTNVSRTDLGLPTSILLPILRAIHNSLTHLHSILKDIEIRIIGGSLLVVWEGDQERAQEGVDWMRERERMIRERVKRDFGDDDDEEYYIDDDDEEEEDTSSEEDEDEAFQDTSATGSETSNAPTTHIVKDTSESIPQTSAASQSLPSEPLPDRQKPKRKPSAPYKIALIDFAHTRFVPGQGPDSGVLLGLETFAELIEERIKEVEESERGRTEEAG
ncbi:hypothetical protein F5890DRAFT_460369 [Lentinula detonsa]|uniref:Kinase n=1 Tax=Lentinula detonsa TaxID=2804962 RepID=A0AA38QA99_9AGAR|nr:hypothetical protein F5890DRAFT_460369 [Lentinula detonsa]